jgi:hypothetical protein
VSYAAALIYRRRQKGHLVLCVGMIGDLKVGLEDSDGQYLELTQRLAGGKQLSGSFKDLFAWNILTKILHTSTRV